MDTLDLGLPPDHPDTAAVLPGKVETVPNIYAGCAKWGRKEWVGTLYPEGTKDKEFLENYVNHFNAIELNSTFYGTKKVVAEASVEMLGENDRHSHRHSQDRPGQAGRQG